LRFANKAWKAQKGPTIAILAEQTMSAREKLGGLRLEKASCQRAGVVAPTLAQPRPVSRNYFWPPAPAIARSGVTYEPAANGGQYRHP
jgi:hypothetical protein